MGDSVKILNKEKRTKHSFWQKLKNVSRYISAIFMYAICTIMIIIFLCFIVNFIDQRINLKNGVTKPALFSAYTIVSPSMVPNINVLDVAVVVRANDPEDIKVGDIITFNSTDYRYSGVTITHRVIEIDQTSDGTYLYTTKGDANNTPDSSRVAFNNVFGKVVLRIPKLGYLQYILSNAYGWIIIIVVPAVLIIAYDIFKLFRTIRNNTIQKKSSNNITNNEKSSKIKKGRTNKVSRRFKE